MRDQSPDRLALVVYQWGDREQNQLLANCLGPAARELWNAEVDGFWFDRFDARGPHIYALFGVSPTNRKAVEDRLAAKLDAYLAVSPSAVHLSSEELEAIHGGCQGKAFCDAHRWPGMGANNTYHFFSHPAHGYPLTLARPSREGELWSCFSDLAKWSVCELMHRNGDAIHGTALRLVHAVDRELWDDREWASRFWRYAASKLLYVLNDERFADSAACLAHLPPWIGRRNMDNFSSAWDSLEHGEDLFPALPRLVALARSEVDRERFSEFALLREVVHCGLAQLGLPVRLRAPLLAFAMLSNIRPEGLSACSAKMNH